MSDIDVERIYRKRGWNSTIPLPFGQKFPPPDGTTGRVPDVDAETTRALFDRADDNCNVGLRMPRFRLDGEAFEVIGIDVDQHGDKKGWETITDLVSKYGPLPATCRSSSRGGDNPGGIYFFLVSAGRKFRGQAGPDVDIVQRGHRYAVAWPSVVDGRSYIWFGPDGEVLDGPPDVADLPLLPVSYQAFLESGIDDADHPIAPVSFDEAERYLDGLPGGSPDAAMRVALGELTLADAMRHGAHDTLTRRIWFCVRLAAEGHPGAHEAIGCLILAFIAEQIRRAQSRLPHRTQAEIEAEVTRAVLGAVSKAVAS